MKTVVYPKTKLESLAMIVGESARKYIARDKGLVSAVNTTRWRSPMETPFGIYLNVFPPLCILFVIIVHLNKAFYD